MQIAHVPVGGDEARNEVKDIGSYAKVAHIDPGCEEALHALFGLLFNVADIIDDFCW